MWTIGKHEFLSFFRSPFGWVLLGVVQFLSGYHFVGRIALYTFDLAPGLAQMDDPPGATSLIGINLLAWVAELFLFIVPLVTMKTISEERRHGTLDLLMASPVSKASIVMGKYLGVMAFLMVMVSLQFVMIASMELATSLDWGLLFSALTGIVFMLGCLVAIGVYFSALVRHPAVAALSTAGVLVFVWNMDWSAASKLSYQGVSGFVALPGHFWPFVSGEIVLADILYFVVIAALFLVLSVRRLDNERLT